MSIEAKQAAIYYASTARRRFFTKRAAIGAEARAIIQKYFPSDKPCRCSPDRCGMCRDPGWSLEADQPERYERYIRKLSAALKSRLKEQTQ